MTSQKKRNLCLLSYAMLGAVMYWVGISDLGFSRSVALLNAVLVAGAAILLAVVATKSWSRARHIALLLRNGLTCSVVRQDKAVDELQSEGGKLKDRTKACRTGLWWLVLVPCVLIAPDIASGFLRATPWYLTVALGLLAATGLAWALAAVATWRERRVVPRLVQAIQAADQSHDWDGCTCRSCRKHRDEGHRWERCRCVVCGQTRNVEHAWRGCRCTACDAARDQEHAWRGCTCEICGKADHQWQYCKCIRCGTLRHSHHAWQEESMHCYECGLQLPTVRLEELWSAKCSGCGWERRLYPGSRIDSVKCLGCGLQLPPLNLEELRSAKGQEREPLLVQSASYVLLYHEGRVQRGVGMSADDIRHYEKLMAIIGDLKDPSSIPALAQVMLEGYPDLQPAAARALGTIRSRAAVPHLLQAIEQYDHVGFYKQAVINALANIGDHRSADAIAAVLPRLGSTLTRAAAFALGKLRDRRAVPLLEAIIRNEEVIGDAAKAKELLRGLK